MKKVTMVLAGLLAALALAAPKPPTAEDPLIAITPVTRNTSTPSSSPASVRR